MKSLQKNANSLLMVLAALAFAGCGPVNIGSDKCEISSCSALPKPIPTQCADGTATAATGACVKAADGTCGWEMTSCAAVCTPGATKPSSDGCNTCSCTADGKWACTLMACDLSCSYNGMRYANGTQFTSSEGCCQCSAGSVKCTSDPTTCDGSCVLGGKSYPNGASVPSNDSCNTCSCINGSVACTTMGCGDPTACTESDCGAKPHSVPYTCSDGSTGGFTGQCLRDASGACSWEVRECPAAPGSCVFEDVTYSNGAFFAGGSGCCACVDGSVTCEATSAYCGNACLYDGKVHAQDETYPSTSPCNTCTCKNGENICTRNACTNPGACTADECGSPPKCATYTCADGSTAGCTNICSRDASGKCSWEVRSCPAVCTPGDKKSADDGCNACTCGADGNWACTEMACTKTCTYGNKVYPAGASYPAEGSSCNTCTCTNGESVCTTNPCPYIPAPCAASECKDPKPTGIVYQCTDGSLAGPTGNCVRDASGVCGWQNRTCDTKCTPGDETRSADGCSKCTCDATGEFVCTQGQCPVCAAGDPGLVTGKCPACTVYDDLTCNDDPTLSVPTGTCVRNICSCNEGYGLNPSNGKCTKVAAIAGAACVPNSGPPSCNGSPEMSSIQGVCLYDGTCLCIEDNYLSPTTGKCLSPHSLNP